MTVTGTTNVLTITAKGATATQAEDIANAVAKSYLAYVGPGGQFPGQKVTGVLFAATFATGKVTTTHVLDAVYLGLLIGAIGGVIIAMARSNTDKRPARERDRPGADVHRRPVRRPSRSSTQPTRGLSWLKLLDGYDPEVVHAWSLRKAQFAAPRPPRLPRQQQRRRVTGSDLAGLRPRRSLPRPPASRLRRLTPEYPPLWSSVPSRIPT